MNIHVVEVHFLSAFKQFLELKLYLKFGYLLPHSLKIGRLFANIYLHNKDDFDMHILFSL